MATTPVIDYVADFETTTDPEDCRVWAWALVPVNNAEREHVEIDNSIESFMKRCSQETAHFYFHNLGFDGVFILDWLFKNNYKHVTDNPRKGEFSTLIDKMGKFYSITVKWLGGTRTEFRDSLKKLPMTVSRIAKSFKLDEAKGMIDYQAYRAPGHVLTDEERDYIVDDVVIVAKALRVQFEAGMKSLTVGSDSMSEFKRLFGGKSQFERVFPPLPETVDRDIRNAYRGGFTYVSPRFQKKVVGPGNVFDVNSLYPSVMYSELLPYGFPKYFTGSPQPTETYPLFVCAVTIMAKLKENHIPCIQIKGNVLFNSVEYLTVIDEPTTVYCTSVDLALWMDHYDIDILSWDGGYYFAGNRGFFNTYIDKWMKVKMESEGGMREIAKLHLNSLYGKFATNPDVTGKVPYMKDNTVHFRMGNSETRQPVYTAMGAFITAYARNKTIRAAQQHYDTFAYADTDSLHLVSPEIPSTLDVDPKRLGAWKHEMAFESAWFHRSKSYTEYSDGRYHTHVAGLPVKLADGITFDHFRNGVEMMGKLIPSRVPGGVVLSETSFKIVP